MDLKAYLDRIGFAGEPRADLTTLRALHRAHLLAIPYENLDVQLGRPVTTDPAEAFDKLVTRRRGGWCYEMNGVFGAVLDAIGFKVTRLAGAVMRQERGDATIGNHLVLLVDLTDQGRGAWIADVGFGDGALEPFPLAQAKFIVQGHKFRLETLDPVWWRFHNHEFGGARSFDFTLAPADPALLAERCVWLQTAPESNFVLNLVCQRHVPGAVLQLLGRSLRRFNTDGRHDRLLGSADELVEVLARDFGLDVPEVADLWPRVCARHEEVLAAAAAAAATATVTVSVDS